MGVTTENSELKSRDHYKSISAIKDAFSENGVFNEKAYNAYYDSVERVYNAAAQQELVGNILNQRTYDERDHTAPAFGKIRDYTPAVVEFANPLGVTHSAEGVGIISTPRLSVREAAQKANVFNTETGRFEDYTPNDLNLLSFWTAPNLVLAVDENGNLKLNEDGSPYYETLGGRSAVGKDLLHVSDILTTDGSVWNQYDFFDSDGIEKSAFGTVMKTVVSVVPYFIPGVGQYVAGFEVARSLTESLPELYKSVVSIAGINSDFSDANELAAFAARFNSSISDEGSQGLFTFESIGNMAVESIKQLYAQRAVWKGVQKMVPKNSPEALAKAKKMAMSYMAITSTSQSYEEFKRAGASDTVAGLGALGTMLGTWGMMNTDYFRDYALGDDLERNTLLPGVKGAAKEFAATFEKGVKKMTKKKAAQMVKKVADYITSKGIMQGALNEGVEEVMEEGVSDMVKGLSLALNKLGLADANKTYDFGFSSEDFMSRYGTAFFGGMLGGAVFSTHDLVERRMSGKTDDITPSSISDLVYYIRMGYGDRLRKIASDLHKKGQLGSTTLSYENPKIETDGKDTSYIYSPAVEGKSQNDAVYKYLIERFDTIESLMKKENLIISDNLLTAIKLDPEWHTEGATDEEILNLAYESTANAMQVALEGQLATRVVHDFQHISENIVATELKMRRLLTPRLDESADSKAVENKIESVKQGAEYKQLEQQLKKYRQQRDDIISGKKAGYYLEQGLFVGTYGFAQAFNIPLNIKHFAKVQHQVDFDSLGEDRKKEIETEYKLYMDKNGKESMFYAFDIFRSLSKDMKSALEEQGKRFDSFRQHFNAHLLYGFGGLQERQSLLAAYAHTKAEIENAEDATKEILAARLSEIENALKKYSEQDLNSPLYNTTREANDDFIKLNPKDFSNINDYFESALGFLEETEEYVKHVKSVNGFIEAGNLRIKQALEIYVQLLNAKRPDGNPILDFPEEQLLAIQEKNWAVIGQKASDNADIAAMTDPLYEEILVRISNIFNQLSTIDKSPALVVIDNILKLLEKDQTLYNSLVQTLRLAEITTDPDNFVIEDQTTIASLEYIKKLIQWAKALSGAAVEGSYNDIINKINNNQKYASIQADSALELIDDLFALEGKIDYLLNVAERSRLSKVKGQQDLYYHFGPMIFKQIRDTETEKLQTAFEKAFGGEKESLKNMMVRFNISDEIPTTPEEFGEQFHKICLFESEFRQKIMSSYTKEDVSKILANLYGEDALKSYSTKFTTDTKSLEARDMLYYIASIINCDSLDFYSRAYDAVKSNKFEKAPLYSQLYAAKIVYSQMWNSDAISFFNDLMLNIYQSAEEGQTSAYEAFADSFEGLNRDYLKNRFILSNFTSLIQGAAGTGKTSGVINLVITLLDDCAYLGIVPYEGQLDGLGKSLGIDPKTSSDIYVLKAFFEKLGIEEVEHNLQSDSSTDRASEEQLKQIAKAPILLEGEHKIIVLDEISLFTAAELELLSKYAVQHGIIVLSAGDFKQNKATVNRTYTNDKGESVTTITPHSIDDTLIFSAPELITSMRAANVAKQMNLTSIQVVMTPVYDKLAANPAYSTDQANADLRGKHVNLVYTNDNNGTLLAGEKIITPSSDNSNVYKEIENILKRDVEGKKTLCIITEDPNSPKYAQFKDDSRVKIKNPTDSQGREYDFVIVDIQNPGAMFENLSLYYTAAQRSKEGTLIVKPQDDLFVSEHFDRGANRIETDEQFISAMKDWFLKAFSWIESEEIPEYSDWYEESGDITDNTEDSDKDEYPGDTDTDNNANDNDDEEDSKRDKAKKKSTKKSTKKTTKQSSRKSERYKKKSSEQLSSDGAESQGTYKVSDSAKPSHLPVEVDVEGINVIFGTDKTIAISHVLNSGVNLPGTIRNKLSSTDGKIYFGYLYWAIVNNGVPDRRYPNALGQLLEFIKKYVNSGKYILEQIDVDGKSYDVISKVLVDEFDKVLCHIPITVITSKSTEVIKKQSLLNNLEGWKVVSEIEHFDNYVPLDSIGSDQYRRGNICVLNSDKLPTKLKSEPLAKMNNGGAFIYVTEDPYEQKGELVLSYEEGQKHTTKLWDGDWHGGIIAVNDVKNLSEFSNRRGAVLAPKDIIHSALYNALLCVNDPDDGELFSTKFLELLDNHLKSKKIGELTFTRTNIKSKEALSVTIKSSDSGLTISSGRKKKTYKTGTSGFEGMKFISDILLHKKSGERYTYKVTSGENKMPFVIPDTLVKTINKLNDKLKNITKLRVNKSISADRVNEQGVWNKVTDDAGLSVNARVNSIIMPRFKSLKRQDPDPKPVPEKKTEAKKKIQVDPKTKIQELFAKNNLEFSEFKELIFDGVSGTYISEDTFVNVHDDFSMTIVAKQNVDDATWEFIKHHFNDLMLYMTSENLGDKENEEFNSLMEEYGTNGDLVSVFVDELQKDSNKISCVE